MKGLDLDHLLMCVLLIGGAWVMWAPLGGAMAFLIGLLMALGRIADQAKKAVDR